MSKFVIAFKEFASIHCEYYSGGSYIYGGERYATFGRGIQEAKRYATRKLAESSARKLANGKCVNISQHYEIIEVEE